MKKALLSVLLIGISLSLSGCGTKNYYYITPPRGGSGTSSKKAPANYSPTGEGFQAVTKPTSYSSY